MFGTGFYNTQTNTNNESVQKFIKLCVDLLNIDNEETAFTTVENIFKDGMNGLAAGGISQVLHCLKPFIFPILNSNQGKNNLFTKLGIKIEKANEEEYYAANCRKIKEYRERKFLTQVEFAELLGVGKTTVTRWETGQFEPTIKIKKKLYELFIEAGMKLEEE